MINVLSAFRLLPHLTKLVPTGYLILAVVALLSVTHGVAYVKGLERYYELKSKVDAAQKEAEADAERQRLATEQINRETAAGWAAAVDWHRRNPRLVRVLPGAGCLSQAGALPAAGQEPDAPTAQPGLGAVIDATACEERLNRAVLDAAQVMWLQDWIQQQHQASQP